MKLIPFLLVFSVIFNNFCIYGSFLLTDLIYTALGFVMLYRQKNLKLDQYTGYLLFFIFTISSLILINFLWFDNTSGLFSQLRFIWGAAIAFIVSIYLQQSKSVDYFIHFYLVFIVCCSLFIIIQNFLFQFFNINIFLSFGEFSLIKNSTEGAQLGINNTIRSGGFFREPSWYAVYAMPALPILHTNKNNLFLLVTVLGILASTSSLGYAFLLLFILTRLVSLNNFKDKLFIILQLVLILFALWLLYLKYDFLFERLIFTLDTGGSASTRIFEPLKYLGDNISLFGSDTRFIKSEENILFVNTLLYIIFSFGIFGLFTFFPLVFSVKLKHAYYSIGLLTCIAVEGLSGRIEFWILIALFIVLKREISLQKLNIFRVSSISNVS